MQKNIQLLFEERYKALNKAQRQAVDTTDGPVMVIAGPGTGKTELLSLRVGNILKEGRAQASSILCLTFTETAASNMRERLGTLIGPDAYRVAIYTFHSFCTDVIGRYPEFFYNATYVKPASDLVQSELLQTIFERLPHTHILSGYHPERGYTYLKECQVRIKDIKKGGLTPDRFEELLHEHEKNSITLHTLLQEYLPERIGKDSVHTFTLLKEAFEKVGTTLAYAYAKSIENALTDVLASEKNTPLSTWKSEYTAKDENGMRVFKDFLALPKLFALTEIYRNYQESLLKEGYFDYEDMILQVTVALSKNVTLRTELEEKYQYIMVDEFQDTNNAQLSLVKALSSNEVHEGRPNVCVVGDDDQAIYKFQGAEISNIHSFRELYTDVTVIVLTENYRSTQEVLDFSRAIIAQGVNRLETRYKEISKVLIAKNTTLEKGKIVALSCKTQEEEYSSIAQTISKTLHSNVAASEIAIIAREHKQLMLILPYLDALSIPYTYTRKENVFDEVHVNELIILCRFLSTISTTGHTRDDLLPQILAFPFWGISRIDIWHIAESAKRNHMSWLDAMRTSENGYIISLAHFFIELGVASETTPLEIILDTLIGSKEMKQPAESVDDDATDDTFFTERNVLQLSFTSPYKKYYFGENALQKNASLYINFLSSLRVFMRSLREYKGGEMLHVRDVGNFVDMHRAYGIPLINETPFAHNENSVQLLTAHKAKGLEFSHVFIISVNDSTWAGNKKGSKISFPITLPLASAGDTEDDYIRLFYVALTRAKHTLYITHHSHKLRFLDHHTLPETIYEIASPEISNLVAHGLSVYHAPPFSHDEQALLKKVVEGYMLSPTHFNNFLNITKGGPMLFLEQNLLRFPQAKTASSVYGSAIHKALETAHIVTKKEKSIPSLALLHSVFSEELSRGRLHDFEEVKLKKRGEEALARYYAAHKDSFGTNAFVEVDFSKQSVVIDDAHLTGKIDKIYPDSNEDWTVVDFKTGKGFDAWDTPGMTVYDHIKLHHYRYQLMMYKLLLEHSRDYNTKKVTKGVLEFVEEMTEDKKNILSLSYDLTKQNSALDFDRFKKLLVAVYTKIVNLDFPDTSMYEENLAGIQVFEDDLISGKL